MCNQKKMNIGHWQIETPLWKYWDFAEKCQKMKSVMELGIKIQSETKEGTAKINVRVFKIQLASKCKLGGFM